MNRPLLQSIKPSHSYGTQIGWENLTYQGLILRVNGHVLVIMADVLHGVKLLVIVGKYALHEPLWHV